MSGPRCVSHGGKQEKRGAAHSDRRKIGRRKKQKKKKKKNNNNKRTEPICANRCNNEGFWFERTGQIVTNGTLINKTSGRRRNGRSNSKHILY